MDIVQLALIIQLLSRLEDVISTPESVDEQIIELNDLQSRLEEIINQLN